MQLPYLATLSEIDRAKLGDVFPFPLDLVKAFSRTGDDGNP
jgi:hypothetical protein